jgi:hypothetical protein
MELPVAHSVVAAPQLPADTAGDQTPLFSPRENAIAKEPVSS